MVNTVLVPILLLTLNATDAAGNSSTDSVTVTITKTDDQNPSISSFR